MAEHEERREAFTFYASFWEGIQFMSKEDQYEILARVIKYGLYHEEPEYVDPQAGGSAPMISGLFIAMKPNIESGWKDSINGKKGGRPPKKSAVSDSEKGASPEEKTPLSESEKPPIANSKKHQEQEQEQEQEQVQEQEEGVAPTAPRARTREDTATVSEPVSGDPDTVADTQVEQGAEPKPKKPKRKKAEPKIEFADDVTLTQTEFDKLVEKHGEERTRRAIEKLSNAKGANGYKYKSDYKAMNSWVFNALDEDDARTRRAGNTYGRDRPNTGPASTAGPGNTGSGSAEGQGTGVDPGCGSDTDALLASIQFPPSVSPEDRERMLQRVRDRLRDFERGADSESGL